MIDGDSRGFVKLVSDPATGIVLGGSIVGSHAAELISVIAIAVSSRLRVDDIAETLYPYDESVLLRDTTGDGSADGALDDLFAGLRAPATR